MHYAEHKLVIKADVFKWIVIDQNGVHTSIIAIECITDIAWKPMILLN